MRHLAVVLLTMFLAVPAIAGTPRVTVTLKPLHSLVAGLMGEKNAPVLLIQGSVSPHRYAPRPSEVRVLHRSDLVIWIGPSVEPGLTKVMTTLGANTRVLTLIKSPELELLPARAAGTGEDHIGDLHHDGNHATDMDPHFWLDPRRVIRAARIIELALEEIDPAGAPRYRSNLEALEADLSELDTELETMLKPVSDRPILVFHDGYQYLEQRYGLNVLGSVAISPDRPPGAKRLINIRKRLRSEDGVCLLHEPQFEPTLADTLIEGTGAKLGTLDPLGMDLPPGPNQYFVMLRSAALSVRDCVQASPNP